MNKPNLLFLLLLLTTTLLQAQQAYNALKVNGAIYHKINDTLYAATTETTNAEYKNFLDRQLQNEYTKCTIDSSQWTKNFSDTFIKPMEQHYHIHPAFNPYPVVNISYYAATKYCQWLTRRYNLSHKKRPVVFRLPTEQEWIQLANINPQTQLPNHLLTGQRADGCYLENIKPVVNGADSLGIDGGFYTVNVDSYWPDNKGLYNVTGNAAEMTSTDGVQKGGSWYDLLKDCLADKRQDYQTPDPRVGFRVVAVVGR